MHSFFPKIDLFPQVLPADTDRPCGVVRTSRSNRAQQEGPHGLRVVFTMLIPRVTSALIKLLSPVASTANTAIGLGKSAVRDFKRSKKQEKEESNPQEQPPSHEQPPQPKAKPHLTLVSPLQDPETESESERPTPFPIAGEHNMGIAPASDATKPSAVFQLFNLFQKKTQPKGAPVGHSYKTAIKNQKRTGFKKGAIVDTKVE